MKLKSVFMLVFIVFSGNILANQSSNVQYLLDMDNASYIIFNKQDNITVSTFNHHSPAETCKYLQKNGITIKSVTNYTTNIKTGRVILSEKRC